MKRQDTTRPDSRLAITESTTESNAISERTRGALALIRAEMYGSCHDVIGAVSLPVHAYEANCLQGEEPIIQIFVRFMLRIPTFMLGCTKRIATAACL